jgi:small subunit ribosomal protein S17
MAETPEETTDASADEVGRGDERSEAGTEATEAEATEAATEAPAAEAKPAAPAAQTRREKLEARRAERRAGARPPRTPEERQAERDAARKARASARRVARTKLREKSKAARSATPGEPTPPREHGEGRQKVRQGVVVSDKADKTITVRIDTARQHRRYHKIVRSSTTLHAHDESNDAHAGDTVIVRESRPLSRLKRWRLVEVVERAK